MAVGARWPSPPASRPTLALTPKPATRYAGTRLVGDRRGGFLLCRAFSLLAMLGEKGWG
jgi:hypothetical protein